MALAADKESVVGNPEGRHWQDRERDTMEREMMRYPSESISAWSDHTCRFFIAAIS